MHEPVPFRTDDAILAFALYIAGVPEFRAPPTNTFTEDNLRRLNYRGLSLWDAAQAAWKHGDRGHVEYWFEKTPELHHFLKCYKDQVAIIDSPESKEDGGEHLREIMRKAAGRISLKEQEEGVTIMDEREALLRIATVILKGRIPFVNRWKDTVPDLLIQDKGEKREIGNHTISYPGFKRVSLKSTSEQLKQLGL